MEDPHLMATVCTAYSQQAASNKELGAAERQSLQLQAWCDTLQVCVTCSSVPLYCPQCPISHLAQFCLHVTLVVHIPVSFIMSVSSCNNIIVTQSMLRYNLVKINLLNGLWLVINILCHITACKL